MCPPQGPLLQAGLYGEGVRTTGYGDEVFVKHIADHMHTVKYKATGGQKTMQQLGFHYVNMVSWALAAALAMLALRELSCSRFAASTAASRPTDCSPRRAHEMNAAGCFVGSPEPLRHGRA